MAKNMKVVVEADLSTFTSEMNKVDKSIKTTVQTAGQASGAVKGLVSSFDTLSGNAVPGLNNITTSLAAAKQMSDAVGKSWTVLKNTQFVTVIASWVGVTTAVKTTDTATKAATASAVGFQIAITGGLAAVVLIATKFVSEYSKIKAEIKEAEEAHKQFQEGMMQSAQNYADRNKGLIDSHKTDDEKTAEMEKQFEAAIASRMRFETALEKQKARVASIQEKINNLEDKRTRSDFGMALGYDETEMDKLKRDLMFAQESVASTKASLGGHSLEQLQEAQRRFRSEQDAKASEALKKEEDAKRKILEEQAKEQERIAQEEAKRLEGLKRQTDSYVDLIKTQDEKLKDEIADFRKLVAEVAGTEFAFTPDQVADIEAKITDKYSEKDKAPTISQQASGLNAMSKGSLEAYQTVKQHNDPNTKILEDLVLVQENQTKEIKVVGDRIKETNELLEK
jgi:hypothetical protein